MKIISYKYSDIGKPGWSFQEVLFGNINLLVGQSASGKTRLLNTIFNLGAFVVRENFFKHGHWEIEVRQDDKTYNWEIETKRISQNKSIISREILKVKKDEQVNTLVEREPDSFYFNKQKVPKLSLQQTSVYLLKEEESIEPLYRGFSSILRRQFFENEMGEQGKTIVITSDFVKSFKITENKNLFLIQQPINNRLFLLREYFPNQYSKICNYFKTVFPFIKEISMLDIKNIQPDFPIEGKMPIFCIKEKSVDSYIPYDELSSGMQKVLLILTDVETMPKGSIYLIDEYENSIGTNAIDFLPSFLEEVGEKHQFFITSHHPYLINNVNPKDWYIFHRQGSEVKIMYGNKNLERFGRSKQQAFVQLTNDPFFIEGIE